MVKSISVLMVVCFSLISIFAQTEKNSAPVRWENYKVSDQEVSVLLPKMPILIDNSDVCSETETKQFVAYADQTVYGFTITSRTKEKAPKFCSQKKSFDEKKFEARVNQIRLDLKEHAETDFVQNDLTVRKISGRSRTYWLFNDFAAKRWFELWVSAGDEEKAEVQNFIKSIVIGKDVQGIEIGSGSDRTLGDETVKVDDSQEGADKPFIIVLKPRPKYTEAARRAQTQGVTRLRVTFLASGGIGSVSPLNELPEGLTEEAVAAARKIVFVPMIKKGTPVSITKLIEYSFSLY